MNRVRKCAMDLLARREHSRQELCYKLRYKGFESDDIDVTIEWLLSEGLLNDARFAENYVRYRAIAGFGPLRIVMELKERGVDESVINQAVWHSEIDWYDHCRMAWQKKYNKPVALASKAYAAQLRFLTQRGYAREAIHTLLQSVEYNE